MRRVGRIPRAWTASETSHSTACGLWPKFDLIIYSESPPTYSSIAEIIKENCRKIGVDVKIARRRMGRSCCTKLNKKEFDACDARLGRSAGKDDPFEIFHGSLIRPTCPTALNRVGYRNPEVDKLIEELRVTMDASRKSKSKLYSCGSIGSFGRISPILSFFSDKATKHGTSGWRTSSSISFGLATI